jgi:putative endonuclease
MRPLQFHVYILANRTRVLYIGQTRDLVRRLFEHREGLCHGFTRRYNVTRLVYFEATPSARSAIARERQLKGWSRRKKIQLIESVNPAWLDLAADWFGGRSR